MGSESTDVICAAPLRQRSVGPFGQYGQWPTFHCQLKPFARARESIFNSDSVLRPRRTAAEFELWINCGADSSFRGLCRYPPPLSYLFSVVIRVGEVFFFVTERLAF